MSDVIIRAENLGKKYRIQHQQERQPYLALRDIFTDKLLLPWRRLKSQRNTPHSANASQHSTEDFWALKDVSFEIKRGEVVGIIGRNGAGKSTLLKILSRITEPTKGRIHIKGRVASLLEVGTGFHPELTGRENIFLNGAILGMTKSEIKAKFDEIVDFAEIATFLDTPVKRYSSGMYVRLAFAVAAHLEPEILVVDEVLAVGDAEFQRKCLGKMKDVAGNHGRTVLFVSHNMPSVQQLCSSGLMLTQGEVAMRASIDATITHYLKSLDKISQQELRFRKDRQGNGKLKITAVTLHDQDGTAIEAAICGQPLRVRIHYESEYGWEERNVDAAFNLRNSSGVLLTCFANMQTGKVKMPIYSSGFFECLWPKVNLRSGAYMSTLFVAVDGNTCDWIQNAFQLQIEEGNFFGSGNLVPRDHGEFVLEQFWSSREMPVICGQETPPQAVQEVLA